MGSHEQNKIWWEKQKNGGWKNLTNPLSQDSAVHSRFNNFIKKFYWQFRQKKGIPRGEYSPEVNFQGFKEFVIDEKNLGSCLLDPRIEIARTQWGVKKTYYATISIVINQLYLLNKLGMERFFTSDPSVPPGRTLYFQEIHFDKLIGTIAHELAHAYQFTINLKKEDEKSQCESSGDRDKNGNLLYPELAAEHTALTEEIKQMITGSTKYQEFKIWWTNPSPGIPEEDEEKVFEGLVALLEESKDLPSLEKNYQIVKIDPLYSSSKNSWEVSENNKKWLDNCYAKKVVNLKLQKSNTNNPNNTPYFNSGLWIFILILWGISLLTIGLLITSGRKKNQKPKKRNPFHSH